MTAKREGEMPKIMISIPEEFLQMIDQAAKAEHRNRSEFFREAAREYLRARDIFLKPIDKPKARKALDIMDRVADTLPSDWSSTRSVRGQREAR